MKKLLTQWELRRKTDPNLELSRLVFLVFLDRAIGGWLVALLFSATRSSCRSSSYCGRAIGGRAIIGRAIVGRDYCESSCHESSYCESSYCGSNHCRLSCQRCSVNERRGRYGPWVSDHPLSHLWLSSLRTASGPRRNSPFDESRTHIELFIKTLPRV